MCVILSSMVKNENLPPNVIQVRSLECYSPTRGGSITLRTAPWWSVTTWRHSNLTDADGAGFDPQFVHKEDNISETYIQ
jgi:hypothetical protein